jgi:hypothetical protein
MSCQSPTEYVRGCISHNVLRLLSVVGVVFNCMFDYVNFAFLICGSWFVCVACLVCVCVRVCLRCSLCCVSVCAPGLPTNLPLPAVIGDGKDDDVASVDGEEGAGQATGDVAGTDVAEDEMANGKGKEALWIIVVCMWV